MFQEIETSLQHYYCIDTCLSAQCWAKRYLRRLGLNRESAIADKNDSELIESCLKHSKPGFKRQERDRRSIIFQLSRALEEM